MTLRLAHARNVVTLRDVAPREHGESEARRRFRVARQALSMSQLEAATLLGVGSTSIEDWERGAVRLPAWALVAIEAAAWRVAA